MKRLDIAYSYLKLIYTLGLKNGIIATSKKLISLLFHRNATNKVGYLRLKGLEDKFYLRISSADWSVFRDIFVKEEYKEMSAPHAAALKKFYISSLDQGRTPVILDCGANIGLASRWYAAMFPEAVILAIEPEASNFDILMKNTSNIKNIIPIQAAISNKRSKLSLKNESDSPWAWQTMENDHGNIDAITISDAMSIVSGGVPFIAKIDIEGHEKKIIQQQH